MFAPDNDEIIVPIKHKDWHDMFDEIEKEDKMVGAFNWDNFYFVKVPDEQRSDINISPDLNMLVNYYRLPEKQGWIRKYMANTSEVKIIEHHFPRVNILCEVALTIHHSSHV